MFAGQGSQYYNMGRELFEKDATFRRWMLELDALVRAETGETVVGTLYDDARGTSDELDDISLSHPAVFCVQYALSQALIAAGVHPDHVLGASLGELAASAVAGALDVEDALRSVLRQAQAVSSTCSPGGMLAALGDPSLHREHAVLRDRTTLAAVNFDKHFVVSGSEDAIAGAQRTLKDLGVAHQALPVRFGFHSPLIEPAGPAYRDHLREYGFRRPRISFVSCLEGGPVGDLRDDHFWRVLRGQMRFPAAFETLEDAGEHDVAYVDVGPSGTMAAFAKANKREGSASSVFAIMTRFNRDRRDFERVTATLAAGCRR